MSSRALFVLVFLSALAPPAALSKTPSQTTDAERSPLAPVPITRPMNCRVTLPSSGRFTPPPAYPRDLNANGVSSSVWFGSLNLWTVLPAEGTWRWVHAPEGDSSQRQKLFWWRAAHDANPEKESLVQVTGKRLDGPAPPLRSDGQAGNGYREGFKSFTVEGIDLPTPGCWEITAHYKNQKLSFVVWVVGPAIMQPVLPTFLRAPETTAAKRIRVDGSLEATALIGGLATRAVTIANARASGTVVLHAVIGSTGKVQELVSISGPPVLSHTAMDAVKDWRFKTTLLDGQPVEVETTINDVFP